MGAGGGAISRVQISRDGRKKSIRDLLQPSRSFSWNLVKQPKDLSLLGAAQRRHHHIPGTGHLKKECCGAYKLQRHLSEGLDQQVVASFRKQMFLLPSLGTPRSQTRIRVGPGASFRQ